MNIKSLLLGSAAAAVAFTGAQAADAIIIAEPEPMEYVRICDAYGVGFFYIPGTETCLRIGGEIRYQIGTASDRITPAGTTPGNFHGFEEDTWSKHARARIYFDARSETEYGQLRGYVRLDIGRGGAETSWIAGAPPAVVGGYRYNNSLNAVNANHVWLSLGGLRMGWTDSAWVSTPISGVGSAGSHSDSGLSYGYQQTQLVQYNFSGANGLHATLSLEEAGVTDGDYMPDVVGVLGVNQAWGGVWAKVGYDEGQSSWAGQVGMQYNFTSTNNLRVIGFLADDKGGRYNGPGGDWSILASYWHQFTPTLGASIGAQYISDLQAVAGNPDRWLAELNVVWTPVTNFAVRTEIVYQDTSGPGNNDAVSGFVRFSRFF